MYNRFFNISYYLLITDNEKLSTKVKTMKGYIKNIIKLSCVIVLGNRRYRRSSETVSITSLLPSHEDVLLSTGHSF